jgi:UDP-glucose 4-epimerase
VRLGIVYGPRKTNWSAVETFVNAVATQDEIRVGSLATARRFIHVTDVAEGIMATFGRRGSFEIFNLQGSKLVSLGDVIGEASRLLGRKPCIVETAPATPSIRPVSSAKASSVLGWSARIGLREGVAEIAAHLGHAGHATLAAAGNG